MGWLICSSELAVSSHSDSNTIYREEKLRVIMDKAKRAADFSEIFNYLSKQMWVFYSHVQFVMLALCT